jgi:hypothetical protein
MGLHPCKLWSRFLNVDFLDGPVGLLLRDYGERKITMTPQKLSHLNSTSSLGRGWSLIPLLIICFAFSQMAQATDVDGVLAAGNTADGTGGADQPDHRLWEFWPRVQSAQLRQCWQLQRCCGLHSLAKKCRWQFQHRHGRFLPRQQPEWVYDAVNAMLLNEFLKEHRKVQDLEATVAQQQKSFESNLRNRKAKSKP